MNERIEALAYSVLKTDTFPKAIPEPLSNENELNDPIAIAQGLRRFVLKQTVEVRSDELLADRYRYVGCDYPADYYCSDGHRYKNIARGQCCSDSPPNDLYYWGWTHVSLDYGDVLQKGLIERLRRIEVAKARYTNDAEKTAFLNGMQIALNTMQDRCAMVADEAERQAALNPKAREGLLRIAEAMRHTPMEPARNFFEAVQCTWSLFLVAPDSLGRIDQYLYPFYRREIDDGTLDREDAKELLQELFVKVYESRVINTALPISGHTHLVVGGYMQNGEDGFNELSELVMECIAELPTYRPQVSFRYTDKTSPETMRLITEYNHRCPLIVFVNDEPRIRGMMEAGISKEDAIEYTVLGCNEWAICGKSRLDLAHINLMHTLKTILFDERDQLMHADNYDEVYRLFEKSLEKDMRRIVADYEMFSVQQARDCNVWTSAMMDDCIENARSFTDDGPRYYGLTMSFNGISNVADSLSVLKDWVFERKRLTMKQMIEVLKANWEGQEMLRREILRDAHFFGNDDAYADGIAQSIILSIDKTKKQIPNSSAINTLVCGSFVGGTSPNILLGKKMPASPDGRYATEELTMGISQSGGRDREGITALLKSISCLDYSKFCGCVVSNLKVSPQMVDTPEKMTRMAQLFHAFLKRGGMQLQINYINNDELRQAQIKPEEYENLMVRVTGYSGYFTLFDRDLQNDIIKRTEKEYA